MKRWFALLYVSFIIFSCQKEGCTDPAASNYNESAGKEDGSCSYDCEFCPPPLVNINGQDYYNISGNLTYDYTLTADKKWLLSGGVFIEDGTTLTIEAGTSIYAADDGSVPFISVQKGAKIIAQGTSTEPIVFTSIKDNPEAGDWGGIILNGQSKIQHSAECGEGEGGTGSFGGLILEDNSGILSYVRIEYAGKLLSTDYELPGLGLFGVGSETQIDHVQLYKCGNDGLHVFGGTVDFSQLYVLDCLGDGVDISNPWGGAAETILIEWDQLEGDTGLEIEYDLNSDFSGQFQNCVIKGAGQLGAVKLYDLAKASLDNFILESNEVGLKIRNEAIPNYHDGLVNCTNFTGINNTEDYQFNSSESLDSAQTNLLLEQTFNNLGTGIETFNWLEGWTVGH